MKMRVLTSIIVGRGRRLGGVIYGPFWSDWSKDNRDDEGGGFMEGREREGLLQLQIVDDSSTYLWLWDALISRALAIQLFVGEHRSDNLRSHINGFIHRMVVHLWRPSEELVDIGELPMMLSRRSRNSAAGKSSYAISMFQVQLSCRLAIGSSGLVSELCYSSPYPTTSVDSDRKQWGGFSTWVTPDLSIVTNRLNFP